MKKFTALTLALLMVLTLAACGGSGSDESTGAKISFHVIVVDLDGNETAFDYVSDKASLGEALQAEGLLEGSEGPYGLYIDAVNGIAADWDNDQTYWSYYIDGEYAMTGVDSCELTEGATYTFVLTQG